jgi:hypothetical protein
LERQVVGVGLGTPTPACERVPALDRAAQSEPLQAGEIQSTVGVALGRLGPAVPELLSLAPHGFVGVLDGAPQAVADRVGDDPADGRGRPAIVTHELARARAEQLERLRDLGVRARARRDPGRGAIPHGRAGVAARCEIAGAEHVGAALDQRLPEAVGRACATPVR